MGLLEKIEQWDRNLLLLVNGAHSGFGDIVMTAMSNKWIWFPLYLFLFVVLFRKHGWKNGVVLLLLCIGMVTVSDRVSVLAFKEVFQRYRPCHNEIIGSMVHLVDNHCGGKYGFVSSHATNHMTLAVFFGKWFSNRSRIWLHLFLCWALCIGFSRIYLGVHYPLDVLGGFLLGACIGCLFHFISARLVPVERLQKNSNG